MYLFKLQFGFQIFISSSIQLYKIYLFSLLIFAEKNIY